ncbi:TPA_asm: hypothetical protein PROPHIFVLQ01-1_86 [Mycobacterium phage prophiFVLQ01-1]|nr:TPA_asm: hypothetical protein PROPHIFVLQ01-1_86 [Mycobacterium phage prophiFVLQ01-1]
MVGRTIIERKYKRRPRSQLNATGGVLLLGPLTGALDKPGSPDGFPALRPPGVV